MCNEFYADAYTIADVGIDFDELGVSIGETEYTQTDVYVIPPKYQHLFEKSLQVVGYMGKNWTLFTEK